MDVVWDDADEHTLRFVFHDPWTWEEHHGAIDKAIEMVEPTNQRVAMIMDLSDSNNLPNNALTHLRAIAKRLEPYRSVVVVSGGNTFMEMMFQMLKPFLGQWASGYHFIADIEAAWQFVREQSLEHRST